jgi:drug/metabolite transporter (DMT)-like permease
MVSYGFGNAFSQPLAKRLGPAQVIFLRGVTICLVLAIASLPSYHFLNRHWGSLWEALGLGAAGYLPVLAYTHGLKVSKIGIISPIAGSAPLVTVLLAYFILHDNVNEVRWLAIAVIILANVAVSLNIRSWRNSNLLILSSGIPFALIAAVGWGLFYFILIYPTRAIGPWLAALFAELGVTIAAGIHLALAKKELAARQLWSPSIVVNGLLTCAGTVAFTIGVRSYNQAIVITLSNSVAVVSTLLGVVFFHERLRQSEILAGASMIMAIIVLSLA